MMEVIKDWGEVIGCLCLAYMTIKSYLVDRAAKSKQEVREEDATHNELELRVQQMESKLSSNYIELTQKLEALEASVNAGKVANTSFEQRILNSVDKVDGKIESVKDLIIKLITNQQIK